MINLISNNLNNEVAITSILENGTKVEISWAQLRAEVCACAQAMLNDGVQPGDRVVAWAPNLSQVIIYSIATSSFRLFDIRFSATFKLAFGKNFAARKSFVST